jgi:flagellar basal-body rod modification protein FlgD
MSAGAVTGTSSTTSSTSSSGLSTMTPSQFIQVLTSELSNQDPFQPTDSNTLIQSLSSLQNVQSQMQLQSSMSSLVLQDQIAAAGNMIGKLVTGLDANNNQVSGVVTAVTVQNGAAMLQLDSGSTVSMSQVSSIANAPTTGTTSTTTNTTGSNGN